jgi:PAS domain S-box-containing protein
MLRAPFWSLRSHLLLLVALAVLPALAVIAIVGPNDFNLAQSLILLAVAALLALALGWLLGGRVLVAPLQALITHIARVERGDLGAPPTGLARRHTEIGRLAQAFEAMEEALRTREQARQAAEEALRASEEYYRIIFNEAPIGIFHFDIHSVIQESNQAFLDLLGADRSALHHFSMFERVKHDGVRKAIQAALDGRIGEAVGEYVSVTASRRVVTRLLTYPIWGKDGRLLGGIGLTEDMTARDRAESALKESERRMDLFFTRSRDAYYIAMLEEPLDWNSGTASEAAVEAALDRQRLTRTNPALAAQLGVPESDLAGWTLRDFYRQEPEAADRDMKALLNQGHLWRERRETQPDGQALWIEWDRICFFDAEGRILGHFGIRRDVTDRKRTEQILRESEQTTRSLFDAVNDAIFVHDLETGAILDVNDRATEMYGYPREAFRGLTVGDISENTPPHTQAEALAWMRRAAAGIPQVFEWRSRDRSGRAFWVEVNMRRATIGGQDRILVAVRDAEARRTAEAALRDAEARYQGLFANSPDSIFWIGVPEQGPFVVESLNPAQEAVLGRPAHEIVGRALHEWLPAPIAARLTANYRRCLEAGHPISYEETLDLGQGHRVFQTLLVPIRNAEGRFHRIVGISADITERRRAEEESQEQERLFRLLFERSGDANLLIDGNQFVDCNQATVDILGAPDRASVLGTHPSELSPPFQPDGRPSKEKVDEMIATAHARGNYHFEWMHRKLDGTDFPVEVLLTAIPWKGKRILHTTWRDRTEARQAEAQRRTLEAQFQQAQKLESLGVLAGGIAHDFNNLLTAVLGNLNLAQFNLNPESPAAPFLESAERTVLKASDLTKQMLAYSGKGRFVVKLHDLNTVVSEMTHLLRVSISKKASLRLNLPEGLPPLEADAAQLQQVIMNLVTNASDALGDEEGTIAISTGAAQLDGAYIASTFPTQTLVPGTYVTLEVGDTGQGMTPDVMARIFDPFFTTKTTGRGLGLSAMLGILKGHKAGLKVYSEVGRGSTFKAFFPAAPGNLPAEEAHESAVGTAPTGTVLLVDDEPSVLDTIGPALEALGLRVLLARDGLEAVERLQDDPRAIDLVLMDLTMPHMDGKEAFQAMRKIRPDLRVILSSGYNEQESIQSFLGRGLAGFLQKPYTLEALRTALRKAMEL